MSVGRRIAGNAGASIVVLVANAAAGILLVPFYIRTLGLAVYGIVPLATTVATYLSLVTDSLMTSVGRYVAVDYAGSGRKAAQSAYTSSVLGAAGLAGALLPVLVVVALVSPQLFRIPPEATSEAPWFFGMCFVAFLLMSVRDVAATALFAANRLDQHQWVKLTTTVLRTVLPVLLILAAGPRLIWVGIGTLVAVVASLPLARLLIRRSTPFVLYKPGAFSYERLTRIVRTGAWMVINQVGSLLHLSVDIVVVNLVLGATIAGGYASVLQWVLLVRAAGMALSGAVAPTTMAMFGAGEQERLAAFNVSAVRMLTAAISVLAGVVGGLATPIMRVWLGSAFVGLAPVLMISVVHLPVNLGVTPLFFVQTAANKVRWPGIVTLITGVLNVVLSIWWARFGGWAFGVALATAVALTLKNLIFTPLHAAATMRVRPMPFFVALARGMLVCGATWVTAQCAAQVLNVQDLLGLVAAAGIAGTFGVCFAWLSIPGEDRHLLRGLVSR